MLGTDKPLSIPRGMPKKSPATAIDAMLTRAEAVTAEAASSPLTIFLGALTILVREGLEALLVVVALLAFLRKADQEETDGAGGGWRAQVLYRWHPDFLGGRYFSKRCHCPA